MGLGESMTVTNHLLDGPPVAASFEHMTMARRRRSVGARHV